MQAKIHFIAGLPRAGSTLRFAILRQNPRFHAGMTGPVGSLVDGMLRNMSMSNQTAIFHYRCAAQGAVAEHLRFITPTCRQVTWCSTPTVCGAHGCGF
jgi:hypothetical protein